MPENPAPNELRDRLKDFVRYRKEHLKGDEKGEAAIYLENFFKALGHEGVRQAGATLEQRIKRRDNGGTAYADLEWKPRALIEMKKAGRDLKRDYRQVFEYWIDLVPDRPQYVVLCNFDEFWVYDLNLQLDEPVDRIRLEDLPRRWEALSFLLPVEEPPTFGNDLVAVTRDTAALVSDVFNQLVARGIERDPAQRFILQAVMAMFAEDIGLLPTHSFSRAIEDVQAGHGSAYDLLFGLFREMDFKGDTPAGRFKGTPHFNGGLYRRVAPFEMLPQEVEALAKAANEDWAEVRPVIFGTLFEQSLDKPERHAFGAYFTSETDIQKVVLPTIVRPWRQRIEEAETLDDLGRLEQELLDYQVLDPACGSGNFLYVAYRELRRIERQLDEKRQMLSRRADRRDVIRMAFVSTKQFHGIDLRPFAVEVAKVTMMLARKLAADELGDERTYLPLDDLDSNFQTDNAVTAPWPKFDVCIGNPPYLGARRILAEKDASEIVALRNSYPDIGGASDYVSYWFRKTHDLLPDGGRAGLVATANIRSGDTRKSTLDYIVDNGGVIHDAVSSQPWSGDASVEVSIVNWTKGPSDGPKTLWLTRGTTKMVVDAITGSLSPETDLRAATKLWANRRPQTIFQGQTPEDTPGFVLSPHEAQAMVAADPKSASVLHPYLNGNDITKTGAPSRFIIDLDAPDAMSAAAQAPAAYERVKRMVLPKREEKVRIEAEKNRELLEADPNAREKTERRDFQRTWWHLWRRRQDMLDAIGSRSRYIALSRHAVWTRPSIYAFVAPDIRPGDALTVFALEDDYSFGILNSTFHRDYFEERCSKMRVDLRYTSRTVWDTYPWPQAPSDDAAETVADVAERLINFRDERIADGISLEAQYSSLRDPGRNPLKTLQEELDAAVAAAYGFSATEDKLAQLLALNQSMAAEEAGKITEPRKPGNLGLPNTMRTTSRIESVFRLA
ncbi:MAG TPA: DNA methyltransferase [Conexibacter sp.]|nr:DNA methyltransferase [Conexibacter sp.]